MLHIIMNPAMVATFVFGFAMVVEVGLENLGKWFHVKLLLLFCMAGFHGWLVRQCRVFAAGRNTKTETFFRIVNEVPTVLLIGIVFLAVLKPF